MKLLVDDRRPDLFMSNGYIPDIVYTISSDDAVEMHIKLKDSDTRVIYTYDSELAIGKNKIIKWLKKGLVPHRG